MRKLIRITKMFDNMVISSITRLKNLCHPNGNPKQIFSIWGECSEVGAGSVKLPIRSGVLAGGQFYLFGSDRLVYIFSELFFEGTVILKQIPFKQFFICPPPSKFNCFVLV